jgi:hypothetical protein
MGCTRWMTWGVLVVAGILLGGCGGDDTTIVEPKPAPGYPERNTLEHVISALVLSYQARDSMETKQLYDSSYVGTSQDLSDPPGSQISTFGYSDEIRHVATLAQTATISTVVMDLGPASSWTRLSSDDVSHPEWAMIQIPSYHIEIYDGASSTMYLAQSPNPMTFAFNPTVTAPGDTLWRIVRWNEIGSAL